ncbi:MAG TPA: aminotransferase class IV [Flavisolibacter sp.]|jgi:D-alanine transaminase/branched-chain amino acid aminotransferase|nr:aminotransferase class IV [Flavisolibacter sp.]
MARWTFLNGQFVTEEKAALHVRDLSIQRGYGVFDFFKVQHSVPVFLEEHLNRFYFSSERMRLNCGYTRDELKSIIFELLKQNEASDTGVRITLTGGYSEDGFQLSQPNLIISVRSFSSPTKEQFEKGITLITYQHQRQLPEVKSTDYLMAIWLQPFIKQNSADDVLYHQNGIVSECPRSNFFIITKDDTIVTASKGILKGVMRNKLIEIAKKNFKVEERNLTVEEIRSAKEAFITSTTKTILPVRQIETHTFSADNKISIQLHHTLLQLQLAQVQSVQ